MVPQTKQIVVVDDSKDDYDILCRGLKSTGYLKKIIWFSKAKYAIEYFETLKKSRLSPPSQIVLLDLNMPGIDGSTVLSLIKSDKKLKTIPTIVFSTSLNIKDVNSSYQKGANTYFQKPLRFQDLQKICEAIRHYWACAATPY